VEGRTLGNEAPLEEEELGRERRGQGGPHERQKRHGRSGKKTARRGQLLFFMMRIDFPLYQLIDLNHLP
jgi:hypothetical protein